MIRHMALFTIEPDVSEEIIAGIFTDLGQMGQHIPSIISFSLGPHSSLASLEGLNQGFTHGFGMDFKTAEARDTYLPHPARETVKKKVMAIVDGGINGTIAFDCGI